MILRFVYVGLLFMFTATASVRADVFRIQLSDDMARLMYVSESFGQSLGRMELEGGYLYSKKNDTVSDYLLHVGTQVRGESLDAPLIITIGGRLYYGRADDHSIGGMGLGGDLALMPEAWNGFGIGAYLYFVPSVITFNDADGMHEVGVTANFQVTSQALVQLGLQQIKVDLKDAPDRTIDEGLYLGVNLQF